MKKAGNCYKFEINWCFRCFQHNFEWDLCKYLLKIFRYLKTLRGQNKKYIYPGRMGNSMVKKKPWKLE